MLRISCGVLAAFVACVAGADDVLVLSSSNDQQDGAVVGTLEDAGHVVTVGPPYYELDDALELSGFDSVYLQPNANWGIGDMPEAGQQSLLDFVEAGGGLVTCEWTIWKSDALNSFNVIDRAFPAAFDGLYNNVAETTYTRATPDQTINAGLPDAFTFPQGSYGGTETFLKAIPGATVYYSSSTAEDGLVGWGVGEGRVISFSSVASIVSVNDPNFGTLLANTMHWAGQGQLTCVADCNASGSLNILDFVCFQQKFQAGDPSADVNGDGNLNILDFVAFQQAFQQGCP